MRPLRTAALLVALTGVGACTVARPLKEPSHQPAPLNEPTVVARAVLPADSFSDGPASGRWLLASELRGRAQPFASQPVQGFSSVLSEPDGTMLVVADNGYGAMENSADFHLRVYRVKPDFARGTLEPISHFELSDPDRRVPFAVVNAFTETRVLTGADFDIESFQRAPDGTFWFGDEFGPYLLHTDAHGRVLEPPYPLPDFERGGELRAPQNPALEEASTLRVLNAMRAHALARGAPVPVVSPWHLLLADGDPNTASPDRASPPAAGLAPASSEVVDVQQLRRAGFAVVPYTVNAPERMRALRKLGVRGLISDRPDLLLELAREEGALLPDGRIDHSRFDAQGHRGARALRPENTLPAMEAALDARATTLEIDLGLTRDGVPLLAHDPVFEAKKCRRADGKPYREELAIKRRSAKELQRALVCDVTLADYPTQRNALALSPVSVAFAGAPESTGLAHPYTPPTLEQFFEFVRFYEAFYAEGAGRTHPEAAVRAAVAREVRFNIELKVNPRSDRAEGSPDRATLVRAAIEAVKRRALQARVNIQSFDWSVLTQVNEEAPELRTACLLGDHPRRGNGNLRGEGEGGNTPWLAGLHWPYRQTKRDLPVRVPASGGFEGLALSPDGRILWALLEKPLADAGSRELIAHAFDLAERRYTGQRWRYPLSDRTTAVGDFILYADGRGLAVERDDSEGDLQGFKRIFLFEQPSEGELLKKTPLVDLLRLRNGLGTTLPAAARGIGLGDPFAFPFITIEAVAVLSPTRIAVLNDNNYPFSVGRWVADDAPDDSEIILIDLPRPLPASR